MIPGLLDVGIGEVVVNACTFDAPLVDPQGFDGWDRHASEWSRTTTIATLDLGDRMGLYDFVENHWWNPLRARRIVVRGSHGELVEDSVVRLVEHTSAVESALAQGCQDHAIGLAIEESARTGSDVRVAREAWARRSLRPDGQSARGIQTRMVDGPRSAQSWQGASGTRPRSVSSPRWPRWASMNTCGTTPCTRPRPRARRC